MSLDGSFAFLRRFRSRVSHTGCRIFSRCIIRTIGNAAISAVRIYTLRNARCGRDIRVRRVPSRCWNSLVLRQTAATVASCIIPPVAVYVCMYAAAKRSRNILGAIISPEGNYRECCYEGKGTIVTGP